jgi:UDP-glucose:(heptosyl)LPS alpha-1,3-glucosyltransferase
MNLAIIRRQYSSSGGAELYAQRLMSALVGTGHAVHLFTEGWDNAPQGVRVHRVEVRASRADRAWAFALAAQKEIAAQSGVFDRVFSLERTLRQDVYRAGDGLHRVCLRRMRQFAPWWRRWLVGQGRYHRELLRLEAQTFHPDNTKRIIVNSEMVRREIVEEYGFPSERIFLVRNGINVARFQNGKRQETRARFGVGAEDYLLLFAGSGWKRKGLRFALEFMRANRSDPRLKLLVAGKGRKSWNSPSNVIFAGAMPDLENACAAADLFLFTPLYEPAANVVFEALAAGLPVVTSAFNGSAEILEPGRNGTVIENPADPNAIAQAVAYWRARPGRLPALAPEVLSLERNVAETVRILEMASDEAVNL